MSTTIAKLGRERSLATLARKVFQIEGSRRTEMQRQAEKALLRANPRLATAEGFRSGATIVVPSVKGIRLKDTVATAQSNASGLADEISLRLQACDGRIEEQFFLSEKRTKEMLAQMDTEQFRRALHSTQLEDDGAIAENIVAKARDRLEEKITENEEKSARLQSAVKDALEHIKMLQQLASRGRED